MLNRLLAISLLLCLLPSVGICSPLTNLTETQLLLKLQANLVQVQNNNTITLNELKASKEELSQVKTNSQATIQSLENANKLLKSYCAEQNAKTKQLKAERNLLLGVLGAALVALVSK